MNELEYIKSNYIECAKHVDISDLSMLEVVDNMLSTCCEQDKDAYISHIILYTWPALEKLYFNQNKKIISVSDCYDIFLDSLYYILEKQVWKDKNNKLYKDEDALIKAIYVAVESSRKNYFTAQNRDKRIANFKAEYYDPTEEFLNGNYISKIYEKYNFNGDWINDVIKDLWKSKQYISAIILYMILNLDIFDGNEVLNISKLKKYLRKINLEFLSMLSGKYKIDIEDSKKYVLKIKDKNLDNYISSALKVLSGNQLLNDVVNNYRE